MFPMMSFVDEKKSGRPQVKRAASNSDAALKPPFSLMSFSRGESTHSSHSGNSDRSSRHSKSPSLAPSASVSTPTSVPDTPDFDYMEPAVDGPPSPERLRQLSRQMKRASHLHRPVASRDESSHDTPPRTTAAATGQSSWDQAMDTMSLSRHSSSRSSVSREVSRDRRPERESVQILGRNLFQRNTKSKRASSSQSSSNSSMYSVDNAPELPTKESLLPSLFTRRKPSRDDTAQMRMQISGPFNFQHVAHTQRENLPDDLHAATAPMDLYHHRPSPSVGSINSDADRPLQTAPLTGFTAMTPGQSMSPPFGSPPPAMRGAKSQDQLRSNPPRSTPSNMQGWESVSSPPVPPPRLSSRQSLLTDGFSTFASPERPRTSGGFRRPQPYDPSDSMDPVPPPPATSHGFVPPADFGTFPVDSRRFSHAITTPDDAAWPLACSGMPASRFDAPLPDVPEEEEHGGVHGRSRLSLASNHSSLRGSHSVPLLRSFSQSQRPTSGASDTLGPSEVAHSRTVAARGDRSPTTETGISHDDWENDIDYCYEHEADANFDYHWERPSLDGNPDAVAFSEVDGSPFPGESVGSSPARSPAVTMGSASPMSPAEMQGHRSPSSQLGVTSNFSLPRGDKGDRVSQLRSIRPVSYASSFRESHGFNLSPSLLIPGDYHQQMLAARSGDDAETASPMSMQDDTSPSADSRSPLSSTQRSSTSTTETNSTSRTDTTGERHASANSTFTNMTRLTVSSSSTSLNKSAGTMTEAKEPMPATQFAETPSEDDMDGDREPTPPAGKDTVPELTPFPVPNFAKKGYHRSHVSESMVRGDGMTPLGKMQDPVRVRRPRARTSSLTAQVAPPVGQYALFPRSQVKGTGDRI